MMFFTLILYYCFARKEDTQSIAAPTKPFVKPWRIPHIEVSKDCKKLCEDWATPYFSSADGCVGLNRNKLSDDGDAVVIADTRFCPDKAAIEAWTVEEELEFEALYPYRKMLEESELMVFQEMTVEREMKLAVHPWQMLLQNKIPDPQDRRRIQGSAYSYRCFGGSGGGWRWYEKRVRPTKLRVRSGRYIDRLEFTFKDGYQLYGGGNGGGSYYTSLPSCTTIVLVKSGRYLDAIQFLSQGYETSYYGGSGGGTYVVAAPQGKCLGDIKMQAGSLVDKICVKFNA